MSILTYDKNQKFVTEVLGAYPNFNFLASLQPSLVQNIFHKKIKIARSLWLLKGHENVVLTEIYSQKFVMLLEESLECRYKG